MSSYLKRTNISGLYPFNYEYRLLWYWQRCFLLHIDETARSRRSGKPNRYRIISNTHSERPFFIRLLKNCPWRHAVCIQFGPSGEDCYETKKRCQNITNDCNCRLTVLGMLVLDTRLNDNVKDVVLEAFDTFSGTKRNYAHPCQAEGIVVAGVNDVAFGHTAKPILDYFLLLHISMKST